MRACLWAVIVGVTSWAGQPATAGSPSFVPAFIQLGTSPPQLILLPLDGPESTVLLPSEPPMRIVPTGSSLDGKAIYAESLNHEGIYKIEFHPIRATVIPGSAGMGMVQCLTVSPSSGRIIVSSLSLDGGILEIDPVAATNRRLPNGQPSSCGGAGGFLSPDGKRAIRKNGNQLDLVDVWTGASRAIAPANIDTSCTWSPNGQSIACVVNGEITAIDASDPSRRRNLGKVIGPVEWSPDSKYLLFRTSQLSCLLTLYFDSLEVLDVDTATRTLVKGSHCRISGGSYGWMDRTVATK